MALDPVDGSLFSATGVGDHLSGDYRVDVRNRGKVVSTIVEIAPDLVFHLAAQPLVRESYAVPVETFHTNVMGTIHVLEGAKAAGALGVLVITTDKVYRNEEVYWGYRESDALGGNDPYSASKACAELAAHAMRSVLPGLPIATARAGNVLGGGDVSPDRLLPDLFRSTGIGKATSIRNPRSVRPWQHVLDPLWGYVLIAEQLIDGRAAEGWNLGSDVNDLMTVGDVASLVCELMGPESYWVVDTDEHLNEAGLLLLDSTLARIRLGWVPRLNAREAIVWTVNWELARRAGKHARELVEADISRYLDLVGA